MKIKIKILRGDRGKWYHNTDNVGKEFGVREYYDFGANRFELKGGYWVDADDCVITELPESFCVKRCDDTEKWKKYIDWLNTKYDSHIFGDVWDYYGVTLFGNSEGCNQLFSLELHIDDIIKHIDFYTEPMVVKSKEEFDMTTNEGRLAYAKKHYPVGTKYKSLYSGQELIVGSYDGHLCLQSEGIWSVYDFLTNKWAEIVDEEKQEEIVMETQKLSRKGLKEIHSVACSSWKSSLELLGANNPLEDYIELNQDQVDAMFKACTATQLPIVSKYLKQDDGSVDISKVTYDENGTRLNDVYVVRHNAITSITKGFWLNPDFNWEVKMISDTPFLVPTKKK